MPASNSEARKRHEAEAATTDAMAEALSNVASGVVLEPLPTSARPPRDNVEACFDRAMTRVERAEAEAATTDAIDQNIIAAMQKVTRILRTGSVEPTVYDLRRVAMMQVGHAAWRQASAEWHAAVDVEARRIIGRSL